MKDEYTPERTPSLENICGFDDCSECPYFLQFDICRTEYATNLYFWEEEAL